MKFQYIFAVALAFLCTMVASLSIPYGDMDDFQVAKLFAAQLETKLYSSKNVDDSTGDIASPTPNTTWYVGENVSVVFDPIVPEQSVSIFFFQLTGTLAGGPISQRTFHFIVPAAAVSPVNGTSLLLAVRRENNYLQAVDSVVLHVRAAKND